MPWGDRGAAALLASAPELRTALAVRAVPDHSPLWRVQGYRGQPRLLADGGSASEAKHRRWREEPGFEHSIPPVPGRPASEVTPRPYRRHRQLAFPRPVEGQRWKAEPLIVVAKRRVGGAVTARRYWPQVNQPLVRGVTSTRDRAVTLGLSVHRGSHRLVKAAA